MKKLITARGRKNKHTARMPDTPNCKLAGLTNCCLLNLGLKKVKQETTAPQIISFHFTEHRSVKNTNTAHC